MTSLTSVLLVAGIVFLAAFVRSALGFGDAVVAMPLLALILALRTASPLVAFMGPTISIIILAKEWRKGDLKSALPLVAASVVGIPLGIYGLARLPEAPLRIGLGILIFLYGLFGMIRPSLRARRESPALALVAGFSAGVLGGAFNANGPPVVAYGMLRGWPPERFRATLQAYFLPTGFLILAGHGLAGLWTGEVLRLYVLSLPVIFLGVLAGARLNRRLSQPSFNRIVYGVLAGMGLLLAIRAFI